MPLAELKIQEQAKQEIVAKIKGTIQLDHNSISKYGNNISEKLTNFSSEILKEAKVKDSPEVEELLLGLVGQLNSIDCTSLQQKKPNFFQKLMGKTDAQTFIQRYESVHSFLAGVTKKLSQAEFTLGKDIETCENYIQQNREYIAELDLYIEAGNQYLDEAKAEYEELKAKIEPDDMLAAQELSMYESEIRQFERKIHSLNIQRTIAIQNIPQLMLIKEGDSVLVEKINSSIDTSIPLWESQMVIAIQIMRQENGAKLIKSITDTNNELLRRNAELLKSSTTAVATELERDIVDLETLQNTNNKLIETIQEIRQIRENGQKEREAVAQELAGLQSKLIETTINSTISSSSARIDTTGNSQNVLQGNIYARISNTVDALSKYKN